MILEMILREEDGDFSFNNKQQALYDRYKKSKTKHAIGGTLAGAGVGVLVGDPISGAIVGGVHQRNKANKHNAALKAGLQGKDYKSREHIRQAVTHGALGASAGSLFNARRTGKLSGKGALVGAGIGALHGLWRGHVANKRLKKVNQQAQQKAREVGAIR